MATTDSLTQVQLRSVADQLGQFMAMPAATRANVLGAVNAPQLGESLAVCVLTLEQVRKPPADLGPLLEPSGMWHHQIHTAAGATHLARSSSIGLGQVNLNVEQWTESRIAGKLNTAMAWVDQKHGDDTVVVRVLEIPAYLLTALLILKENKPTVVLADRPESESELDYETEYPLRKFLKLLAKEIPATTLM